MKSKKAQVTVEMILVVALILLMFTLALVTAHRKNVESTDFKLQLDAKRIAQSLATNINSIAEQGPGYFKFFSLPAYLYGGNEYTINVSGNFVEIYWDTRYGEQGYITQVVTSNVSDYCIDKGEDSKNKVFNYGEKILISCERSDIMIEGDSLTPLSAKTGDDVELSFNILSYGVLDAENFNVSLTLVNQTGGVKWGPYTQEISLLAADSREELEATMPSYPQGIYYLLIEVDSEDSLFESYGGDNVYNATFEFEA